VLYKEDLDDMTCTCGKPACEDPIVFHGRCHPRAKTWCYYFDGMLTVRCADCDKVVTEVAVARKVKDDKQASS